MKKSISVILMLAMLLSSILAIIPMSAATEDAGRTNVLFSDADAANYQFTGSGNVFYYDYHYYVDVVGTFPLNNKGPSLRVGNNSGSGTASATDGKPFAGSMQHHYSNDCAVLTLADGSTVTHDHVFGYSFKESVTIDSFKLYVSADKDNRDNISRVTVYGATVDPGKKYSEYRSGQYYYSTVTPLYNMPEGANVQDNRETQDGVTAAVVSGDFDKAATVDYILFAVDFDTISAKKYTVLEAEAYGKIANSGEEGVVPPEDNESSDSSLVYEFDFRGDDKFKPAVLEGEAMAYVVAEDGRSVTVKGDGSTGNQTVNMWGGIVAGINATLSDVYSFTYRVKANADFVTNANTAQNNSVGVGAWLAPQGDNSHAQFYNNYTNHNTAFGEDISMRRSALAMSRSKYNAYTKFDSVATKIAVDKDGFSDMLIVYDGPAGALRSYYLNEAGEWQFVEEQQALNQEGDIGFFTYAYYAVVNTTFKDAKVYSGDISGEVSNGIKVDFANLTYKSLMGGAESADNFADLYDITFDGNSMTTAANNNTPNDKSFNLGYVAQSEYAITKDSYYVYEFKAKLNRPTGYACVVFAANGNEHYFVGGAFANDGDFDDTQGNQASHIHLHKNEWYNQLNDEFGDHMTIPVYVDANGYGSWRVIYDALTISMQYIAKDGFWTYITHDDGSISSITLPENFYVAFGAHNRGGAPGQERTIKIKDAVLYNCPVSDDSGLRPIDKDSLNTYIKYVEETFVDSNKYEALSWAVFEVALANAKDANAQKEISQYDVDKALEALKDAVSALKLNKPENDVFLDGIVPEKVDFANLDYKSLLKGQESEYNFADMYDIIYDGNSLITKENDKTSDDKMFELGYVSQSEYAITSDSYYVYEFKAKLNRPTGYSGVVFAANGNEHYFVGGAFANDGDHMDAEGNSASHIRLYKNMLLFGGDLNSEFGNHMVVPTLVENGYGSWRVIYDGLTVKVQYIAKDGFWTYITNDDGSIASITLPDGFYVAFGLHHRGGTGSSQRTISLKDAVFYDRTVYAPANKTALNAYIEYVENTFVNSFEYDATSWAALENALAAAKEVSAQEEVSQNVINARLAGLEDAVSSLKPNTSELDALISEYRGMLEHNYTKESWKAFKDILYAVDRSEKNDYATVMKLYDDLLAAKNALVAIDYDMLKTLIVRVGALSKDDYTADSWAALMLAVDAARSALTSADQSTVDGVVESLGAAMDALVLNKEEEGTAEDPTDDIGEKPTGDVGEQPTGDLGENPTDDPAFADPMFRDMGCGGVIGTSAVIVAVLLGMVALKKKED